MTSIPKRLKMKKRQVAIFAFFTALRALAALPGVVDANHLQRTREARYVMGTILEITLYYHDVRQARQILEEAFSLAQRLDSLLSNYKSESEINRLNRKAGTGPVKISAELYGFLELAKSLARNTDGAFDITVGPLMELWQKASKQRRFPSEPSTKAAQSLVGSTGLILYLEHKAELRKRGMSIDTGGIGKGYAVDRIADLLKSHGITRALVNFGYSSIRAMGTPPHALAWRLLLQFPGDEPLGILEVKDQALSASSSLGKSFEIEGKTYGHLIDPKLGTAVSKKIQAVVLSQTASVAEALSKYVILRNPPEERDQDLWSPVKILRLSKDEKNRRSEGFPLLNLSRDKQN